MCLFCLFCDEEDEGKREEVLKGKLDSYAMLCYSNDVMALLPGGE